MEVGSVYVVIIKGKVLHDAREAWEAVIAERGVIQAWYDQDLVYDCLLLPDTPGLLR
jgi:hypothetical protein